MKQVAVATFSQKKKKKRCPSECSNVFITKKRQNKKKNLKIQMEPICTLREGCNNGCIRNRILGNTSLGFGDIIN